jgi:hypothetical protein
LATDYFLGTATAELLAKFVFDGELPGLKKKEFAKSSLKRDDASKEQSY